MRSFRDRFREESWYGKPQDRTWSTIEKALERFIKVEIKKFGGKVCKKTSKRDFDRFKTAYQSLFFAQVNDLLKKDVGVKNGLFAAMGAGAATLAEGHVFWMKDMTGDDDSLQNEFDGLSQREQRCATSLQELSRNLMLYHIELVISDAFRTKLVDLKRQKDELGDDVEWSETMALLRKQLKNQDTRYLAESVFTVRREDQSALIEWVLFFMSMIKYCTAATIVMPTKLYYQLFIGQVSALEIKHVVYAYPRSEEECDEFEFDEFRDHIKTLQQDKMPTFYAKQVRAFTATMLVAQKTVRFIRTTTAADLPMKTGHHQPKARRNVTVSRASASMPKASTLMKEGSVISSSRLQISRKRRRPTEARRVNTRRMPRNPEERRVAPTGIQAIPLARLDGATNVGKSISRIASAYLASVDRVTCARRLTSPTARDLRRRPTVLTQGQTR